MTESDHITAVILAAGIGSRMKSQRPKAMQRLANEPMIAHLVATASEVFDHIIVVIGPDMADLEQAVVPHHCVIQQERLGTGHAALMAETYFGHGDVVFLYADNPLLTAPTMKKLRDARKAGAILSLLAMRPENLGHYGRVITTSEGCVSHIVEYKDATEAERAIPLCNAGMICTTAAHARKWLNLLHPDNAQSEYYLTDLVALAAKEGKVCAIEAEETELAGVNSRAELARAESLIQQRFRKKAMEAGITLVDPSSVFFSRDTKFAPDVVIEPNVFIGPGVCLGEGVVIRGFSHLEGCIIGQGAVIGPYARLRPGTYCAPQSHVGNFVELKNTHLGQGSKAGHLSYLGDATIGQNVNIGAGSITCNYDGVFKHQTHIGDNSFVGSDSILVAPLDIGENAVIAAGSVITKNIDKDAMAFGRALQHNKKGRGKKYRELLKNRKEQG